jgi:protein SCO1/2
MLASLSGLAWMWHTKNKDEAATAHVRIGKSVGMPSIGGSPWKLTSHHNQQVTSSQFATTRQFPLIYFGFTHCPEVCPRELRKISDALALLDKRCKKAASRVAPLYVSLDPPRDTPERMATFLRKYDPRITGLTGDMETVKAMAKDYKVYFARTLGGDDENYILDHSVIAYFLSPDNVCIDFFGANVTAPEMAARIHTHLTKNENKDKEEGCPECESLKK